MEQIARTRIYKKTSSDSVLTLYLSCRDLVSKNGIVEPLKGVIYVNPKFIDYHQYKIYGQLTLMFRYGREDEEVMGLKFCSETVIAIKQILPIINIDKNNIDDDGDDDNEITPVQKALVDRLGVGAYPFSLEIVKLAPPSIQLIPAKKYNGQPIGTSYEIRIFMVDINDEKLQPRTQVRLGVRLLHKIPSDKKILEQTMPTYTSLPKGLKSRLSPKHLRLHCQKNQKQNSKSITSIDLTTTVECDVEKDKLKNLENNEDILLNKTSNRFHKQHSCNCNCNQNLNANPDEIIICSGGTIRLPNAPTTTANITTHPLILNSFIKNGSIKINNNNSVTDFNKITLNRQVITLGNRTSEDNISTVTKGPIGCINKPFLFAEGRVCLRASLNKSVYKHGENVCVSIDIRNSSKKIIKKIKVYAVQHIDVCMFSDGKFKNIVADINEIHQIKPNECYNKTYNLIPQKGPTKNWIAIEGGYLQGGSISESSIDDTLYKIASSAHRGPTIISENSRNQHLFAAIYVSYYVKIKLILSGMGGEVSLKLPFIIGYVDNDTDIDITTSSDDENEIKNNNNNNNNNNIEKNLVNNKLIEINDKGIKQPTDIINNFYNIENDVNNSKKIISPFKHIKINNDERKKKFYEQETISLLSVNELDHLDINKKLDENIIKLELDDENDKIIKDKNLLKMLKLKRTYYSRSCEGMNTFCR